MKRKRLYLTLLLCFSTHANASDALEKLADAAASRYNVPPALLKGSCSAESNWAASAVGDDGKSFGVCQIQPATALLWMPWFEKGKPFSERWALVKKWLMVPANNIYLSARILKYYLDRFDGNEVLAVMAYNGGPDAQWIKHYERVRKAQLRYEENRK